MSSNSHGADLEGITASQEFWCFDHLPKTLRKTIANAPRKYCAAQAYELWHERQMTCREIIAAIRAAEAEAR
jgi:putative hemolysin